MRKRFKWILSVLIAYLLLLLLFLHPKAAIQGASEGLKLWAFSVLPALLPFFIVTSVLQSLGGLRLLAPLGSPFCRLCRLPREVGGVLSGAWLCGAPNGARLLHRTLPEGHTSTRLRFAALGTVTGPLFLIGSVGPLLSSGSLGFILYLIQFIAAICNGFLWSRFLPDENAVPLSGEKTPEIPFSAALSDSLGGCSRSMILIGAGISFFSALHALLEALGFSAALEKVLCFYLPQAAVSPLLAGMLEMSRGCILLAQIPLGLPLRASLICGVASFGGLSVLMQTLALSESTLPAGILLLQRITHALLAFFLCRGVFLLFGGVLPVFGTEEMILSPSVFAGSALPAVFCILMALLPRADRKKG